MNRSTKGAPGDEPAAAPAVPESPVSEGAGTSEPAGATQPKRRRGSRGGRRHRKPATAAPDPGLSRSSSPRDGYAADALASLPTAPLVPVGAPQGARGESRPEDKAGEGTGVRKARGRREPGQPVPAAGERRAGAGKSPGPKEVAEVAAAAEDAPVPKGEAAGRASGEAETEAEVTPPKRRRRGSRGGRRRHKSADIEHEEAAREAEEAAGEPTAADAGALEVDAVPATKAVGSAEATEPEDGGKRRRRGTRGGQRTSAQREAAEAPAGKADVRSPAVADAAAEDATVGTPSAPPAQKGRSRDRRRPMAIVRQDEGSGLGTAAPTETPQRRHTVVAERPERKTILVTDDGEELRVALVEDGRLSEIYIERPDRKSYLGDIYQGKVENVMSGIDAAFVDFGLEKNGFLYVDEVTTPEGEKRARRIGDALKNGQQVLVQVIKDPMGHKGARLSTKISLAGRYLVYVPGGSGVGVSRRLRQGERERLRDITKELAPKNAGLIVAHHRGGARSRGPQARPALPFAPVVKTQEEGRDRQATRPGAQGGRHLPRGDA